MKVKPFFRGALVWHVSARWCRRRHNCTLAGILKNCHGNCCKSKKFWPPAAYGDAGCVWLGPKGCSLDQQTRPAVCSLYPLRLVKGTLVLYIRATYPKGHCAGNHGDGPMIIDALKSSLIALFGQEQYDRVRADVVAGKNSYFVPSEYLLKKFGMEDKLAKEMLPYVPL